MARASLDSPLHVHNPVIPHAAPMMAINLEPYAPHPLLSPFYPSTNNGLPEHLLPEQPGHLAVLDQQIAVIEQQYFAIKARRKALYDERASCNSLIAPIRRIPEELLSIIFLLLIDRPRGLPVRRDVGQLGVVAIVCRKWYQTVSRMQEIRRGLELDYPLADFRLAKRYTPWQVFESWASKTPRNGPLAFKLSRPSKFCRYEFEDGEIAQAPQFARILSQHRSWTRLEFMSEDSGPDCWIPAYPPAVLGPIFSAVRVEMETSGISPWASVTCLKVSAGAGRNNNFPISDVPLSALPNLLELELSFMKAPMQSLSHPRIQVLNLSEIDNIFWQGAGLVAALASLPALRKLVIARIRRQKISEQQSHMKTLPLLELQFRDVCPEIVERILSSLSIPHLKRLALHGCMCGHSRSFTCIHLLRITSNADNLRELLVNAWNVTDLVTMVSNATGITHLSVNHMTLFKQWGSPKWNSNQLRQLVDLKMEYSWDSSLERMFAFFESRYESVGDGAPLPETRVAVRQGWPQNLVEARDWTARFAAVGVTIRENVDDFTHRWMD